MAMLHALLLLLLAVTAAPPAATLSLPLFRRPAFSPSSQPTVERIPTDPAQQHRHAGGEHREHGGEHHFPLDLGRVLGLPMHSHNDEALEHPLVDALRAGCCSIEVGNSWAGVRQEGGGTKRGHLGEQAGGLEGGC